MQIDIIPALKSTVRLLRVRTIVPPIHAAGANARVQNFKKGEFSHAPRSIDANWGNYWSAFSDVRERVREGE